MATGHCTSYVVRLGTTVRGVEYPLFLLHRDILLNLGRNVVFLEVIVIQKSEKGTDPDTWVNIRHFGSLFWTRSNYPTWGGSSPIRHWRRRENYKGCLRSTARMPWKGEAVLIIPAYQSSDRHACPSNDACSLSALRDRPQKSF